MSADLLRRAATAEREEWSGDLNARVFPAASVTHLALADLLDSMADGIARRGVTARLTAAETRAITLARRILGEP